MVTVYIWGEPTKFENYHRAIALAGGQSRSGGNPLLCDALLLPGGGDLSPWRYGQENIASRGLDPKRDGEEFALLDAFIARKKPILGICRGLQAINVYFGGTLIQDLPGHSAVEGIDRLHFVRSAPSPFADLFDDRAIINSSHHQAADRLGIGLSAVQWAPDGTVEALVHRDLPIWAVQWHPERTPGTIGIRLIQEFLTFCQQEISVKSGIIY